MPAHNVRIYKVGKPAIEHSSLLEIATRICRLLGPALPDRQAWELERPGILGAVLVNTACRSWRIPQPSLEVSGRPSIMGSWIVFDYLFSKTAKANPLITCLTALGVAKYGRVDLKNTYLVTVGLNIERGRMLFLYKGGRSVDRDLDSLAYVISHILEASAIKKAVIDLESLAKAAYELNRSIMWKWVAWETLDGSSIPAETVKSRWKEEYEEKLRKGEWRVLEFKSRLGKIKLKSTERSKAISINVKKSIYAIGSKRDLKPVFDELFKIINPDRFAELNYDHEDLSGILRSSTERRGILASEHVVRDEYKIEPRDVSYEFRGYDIEAGDYKIEVKAFRDGPYKSIELTENEYKAMNELESYTLFVVEDAWDKNPKVNIIRNPRELTLNKKERNIPQIITKPEIYYECDEERWKQKVETYKYGRVSHAT
jgi:hypothetical protein